MYSTCCVIVYLQQATTKQNNTDQGGMEGCRNIAAVMEQTMVHCHTTPSDRPEGHRRLRIVSSSEAARKGKEWRYPVHSTTASEDCTDPSLKQRRTCRPSSTHCSQG